MSSPFQSRLFALTRSDAFVAELAESLLALCRIDTGPNPDVRVMAQRERAVFDLIEGALRRDGMPELLIERRPVAPGIAAHPAYSQLHFTKTAGRPRGLTPRQAYRHRCNLVCTWPVAGRTDGGVALNAHVDVIAPYVPPRLEGGIVYGRGACDDKGGVVAIVAALQALARLGVPPARPVTAMFPIEEETGGNGSLALALDRDLKARYDSILVAECTGLRIHPANRGAVWYRVGLSDLGLPPVETAAHVVEALENEGRAIRAESRHALFPQRPVQTCHGILGPFGEHPSRICGRVEVEFILPGGLTPAVEPLLRDVLDSGLAEYIGLYGDKTRVPDPATGRPKVERHYELVATPGGCRLTVHGATGHMGSILENDGAITKAAAMIRAVCRSRARLDAAAGGRLALGLPGAAPVGLVLEGGQGFVPTHTIENIMDRLRAAAWRGVANFATRCGRRPPPRRAVSVTFDKLHNAAFDGDPDSAAMRRARRAARACGLPADEPPVGWNVSCDARLFATEYPGMPVLTVGPGSLAHAHADGEQLRLDELRQFVEFLALYLVED